MIGLVLLNGYMALGIVANEATFLFLSLRTGDARKLHIHCDR